MLPADLLALASGRLGGSLVGDSLSNSSFSPALWAAIGCVAVGLVCQALHRRMPAGLGTSLFVGAVSLAVGIAATFHQGPALWNLYQTCHVTSLLCLLWATLGWFTATARPIEEPVNRLTVSATFFAWALVTGIGSLVLTLNSLLTLTWTRVFTPFSSLEGTAVGLWDVTALAAAVLFWCGAARRPQQPAMLLTLAGLFVWWTGLMIPSLAGISGAASTRRFAFQPTWWNWVFQIQVGLTLALVTAAVLQDVGYRARRRRAWPDRIDLLLEPYSRWPAFIRIEAMIAGALLVLGVYQLVRLGPPGWPLAVSACGACIASGFTCLFMAYRRWSANTAGLGMALLSLAAVYAACALATIFYVFDGRAPYAARMPAMFNAILFALALMMAWWRWLAKVWDQQLHDGAAWTTAGRLIPYTRRTVFILGALAMLVAFQMALWPELSPTAGDDRTVWRILCGLGAIVLLMSISGRSALERSSPTRAWLTVAFAVAGIVFILIRLPPGEVRGWLLQHRAAVLSACALPVLAAAEVLTTTRGRCFSEPLWLMALLVLPASALGSLLVQSALPEEWVRPLTLAILGALYCFAASREGRRVFFVLGAVLLVAAMASLYRSYGATMMGA